MPDRAVSPRSSRRQRFKPKEACAEGGFPQEVWPLEEFFDQLNPRFETNAAALEAGWLGLMALVEPYFVELECWRTVPVAKNLD